MFNLFLAKAGFFVFFFSIIIIIILFLIVHNFLEWFLYGAVVFKRT